MQQPDRSLPPLKTGIASSESGVARPLFMGRSMVAVTSEDFLTGYQEGHLTYMVQDWTSQHTDESITALVLEQLESLDHSSLHGTGFIVGWLVTLITRGTQRREGDEQRKGSGEEAR